MRKTSKTKKRVVDPNATARRRRHELASLPPGKDDNLHLTISEVCALTSLSAPTIWRLRGETTPKAIRFPNPIRLGHKRVAWRRDLVEKWLRERPEAKIQ